jgi:transposase
MNWKKLLESISASVNEDLRLRQEYLIAENRILRQQINGRVQLTNSERKELAAIGAKLGKKALEEIATVAKPDTILAWGRKFADQKADTSEPHKSVGRPRMDQEIEDWVVRMARENSSWGYDRIQGALNHLGYTISDQTVGNILKRHGISPAPERKKTVTWREFIRFHQDVFLATDFFNSDVWSWFGLIISCLLSFIHFSRHQVHSAGMMLHQHMQQIGSHLLHGGESAPWPLLSEPNLHDDRRALPHMGEVIILPVANSRQIRDGPMGCRQQFGECLKDDDRKAA